MNPLSKIIRPRKTAKDKTSKQPQTIDQQPAEAPRPLDEAELKLVGGGGEGTTKATPSDNGTSSPRGSW